MQIAPSPVIDALARGLFDLMPHRHPSGLAPDWTVQPERIRDSFRRRVLDGGMAVGHGREPRAGYHDVLRLARGRNGATPTRAALIGAIAVLDACVAPVQPDDVDVFVRPDGGDGVVVIVDGPVAADDRHAAIGADGRVIVEHGFGPAAFVAATLAEWLAEGREPSAMAINSGSCEDFAEAVAATCPDFEPIEWANFFDHDFDAGETSDDARGFDMALIARLLPDARPPVSWDEAFDEVPTGTHVWCLHANGLSYDSEAPGGVANPFDLPFFRRRFNR